MEDSRSYVVLPQATSERLSMDRRFGGAEFRVLYALFSRLDDEGSVQISQADLGEMIGMKQQGVSKAIKTLVEAEVFRSTGKPGQTVTYTFNPDYGNEDEISNVVPMHRKWDGDR
jgi:hypothetical protein